MVPRFSSSNISNDGSIQYVDTLANYAIQLMQDLCSTVDTCPNYGTFTDINSQLETVVANFVPTPHEDPCAAAGPEIFNQGLHIAAIFIILMASMAGTSLPLLSKYHPRIFTINPYYIALGKCMGVGVLISLSLVHMLLPAAESLVSPCISAEFNEVYPAYAYMFCMLAIMLMQLLDFIVELYITRHFEDNVCKATLVDARNGAVADSNDETNRVWFHGEQRSESILVQPTSKADTGGAIELVQRTTVTQKSTMHSAHEGHAHSLLLSGIEIQTTISAFLLEFGLTVHSIFIGITTGVASELDLKKLLVALCFHQLFEGVALGARLSEASIKNHWLEFFLVFVFSISAPLGIGMGIAVASSIQSNVGTYAYVQGIFDAICSGILLYLGLLMLFHDFKGDMKSHCGKSDFKKFGMFVSMWLGAAFMAFIGKYL